MTVNKLIRLLEKLCEGNGRMPVTVNTSTFKHPLEKDGCIIVDVDGASIELHPMADGDGFRVEEADGSERHRLSVVLTGSWEARS